jgi:hypothetical protein
MATQRNGAAKRLIFSLAAGAALSGCVYDPYYPYYGAYDQGPAPVASPTYSAPTYYYPYSYYPYGYYYPYRYVGPPVSFNFGYYHYSGHGWGGGHGWSGGHGGGGHWGGGHGGGHGHR